MTEESARRYDTQVEVLFNGTANATRRQALPQLHEVFAGRDQRKLRLLDIGCGTGRFLDLVKQVWPEIIRAAETANVTLGIENCPMLFSKDEWPGGKNLAISPKIWREMFRRIPSPSFGLNYDPSHLVWQFMDHIRPIEEFSERIFHVHAKDLKIWHSHLDEAGIMDFGWNSPKLPGLGDVDWPSFFAMLTHIRYTGPVCIEVEDAAYEATLADRKRALIQSKRFLHNYI
jgi:sugar phosphate isomerase/epimerase